MFKRSEKKNVLFVGLTDEKNVMHYVPNIILSNLTLQEKNDYADWLIRAIGWMKINLKDYDAVVFFSHENDVQEKIMPALNKNCLVINFEKAQLSLEEIYNQILTFDHTEHREWRNTCKNSLLLLESTQDLHCVFAQLPKELLNLIVSLSFQLHVASKEPIKEFNTFHFFKALKTPIDTAPWYQPIVASVEDCKIM